MSEEALPHDPFERYERWAHQLGKPWEKVLKSVGIAHPKTARASRTRARKGGAPQVTKKLRAALLEEELKRTTPTAIGELELGLDEWRRLGESLAALDREAFLKGLGEVRRMVDARTTAHEADEAFSSLK
jgi:hypothetical protein